MLVAHLGVERIVACDAERGPKYLCPECEAEFSWEDFEDEEEDYEAYDEIDYDEEEWEDEDLEDDEDWEEYYLPSDGCGGPELIKVNKNLESFELSC